MTIRSPAVTVTTLATIAAASPGVRSRRRTGLATLRLAAPAARPDRHGAGEREDGGEKSRREEELGRRHGRVAARPPHDQGTEALSHRARHHVIAEHRFPATQ